MELGELSRSHALALLMAKDPQVRPQLARATIEEGWSISKLEARTRESNRTDSAPNSPGSVPTVAMNVATVWGDLLGAEVSIRTLRTRKLRLEVMFDSPPRRHSPWVDA